MQSLISFDFKLKTAMMCQEYGRVDDKIVFSERNFTISDNTNGDHDTIVGSRIADAVSNNDWA